MTVCFLCTYLARAWRFVRMEILLHMNTLNPHTMLPFLASAAVAAAESTTAPTWYALSADRNKDLTTCTKAFGGQIEFENPSSTSWWTGSTSGNDVCQHEGAKCSKVIDWRCNVLSCDSSCEASRATLCVSSVPTPPPAPTPPQPPPAFPNSHACLSGLTKDLPFCNTSLPNIDRLKDLVGRMTLDEKCKLTGDGATAGGGPILRLGIPKYSWNTEALHGLAGACLKFGDTVRCPTVFPAPPGMGASFNLTLAETMGTTIGDEARAMNNFHGCRARGGGGCGWGNGNWFIGLNVWVPNLNIYRDPRWGRNVEVPSEDPFHSGQYGAAVVRGVQWGEDKKYTKINAALKHFWAYSVESGRGALNFEISAHDIADTYLPSFEAPIRLSDAKGYMCSYASVNGVPSCASHFISQEKARGEWNFSGYVVTDCGAVNNMIGRERYAKNITQAAAYALRDGGVDINCGGGLTNNICQAVKESLVSESTLDASLHRSLGLLMEAGMFDPIEDQPYTRIPFETIGSDLHRKHALDAARQAQVLLKNDGALPLSLPDAAAAAGADAAVGAGATPMKVAVVGPHTRTTIDLAGNYFEDICPDGGNCVVTMQDALTNLLNASSNANRVIAAPGCKDTQCSDRQGFKQAVEAAQTADVVILALGLCGRPKIFDAQSQSTGDADGTEGEGHDRMNISLPSGQMALLQQVVATAQMKTKTKTKTAGNGNGRDTKTKVIVTLFAGGGLDVSGIVGMAGVNAVVYGFYPGVAGATAVVDSLFGRSNRWGKMPYTLLSSGFATEAGSDFDNMNMTDGVGRSYRYYKGKYATFNFGFGLSYTTFAMAPASPPTSAVTVVAADAGSADDVLLRTAVKVTNTGKMAGDEVVFLFHNATAAILQSHEGEGPSPDPLAIKQLIAFERVSLGVGESKTVNFSISARALSCVSAEGTRHTLPGLHHLTFSRGHGDEIHQHVQLQLPERMVISTL